MIRAVITATALVLRVHTVSRIRLAAICILLGALRVSKSASRVPSTSSGLMAITAYVIGVNIGAFSSATKSAMAADLAIPSIIDRDALPMGPHYSINFGPTAVAPSAGNNPFSVACALNILISLSALVVLLVLYIIGSINSLAGSAPHDDLHFG